MGADDALRVDFCAVGCCYLDCVCWAEVEVLNGVSTAYFVECFV